MIDNITSALLRTTLIIRIVTRELVKKISIGGNISFEITGKVHAIDNLGWKKCCGETKG